ncbi:hypothetical protein PIROE2DRAFT_6605 [Piromyces sp. E2]|nr:hypothetical protein PIROE2DRAFT_6605 [Piromyces sp. E2]|eukprot:OUM66258.1 hypothetical protein PIROE2DRAFT_6605 [Piromyces sp. E2]
MPIVSDQRWSVIRRNPIKVTKNANADNTVRQVSGYSYSLSGSQTHFGNSSIKTLVRKLILLSQLKAPITSRTLSFVSRVENGVKYAIDTEIFINNLTTSNEKSALPRLRI